MAIIREDGRFPPQDLPVAHDSHKLSMSGLVQLIANAFRDFREMSAGEFHSFGLLPPVEGIDGVQNEPYIEIRRDFHGRDLSHEDLKGFVAAFEAWLDQGGLEALQARRFAQAWVAFDKGSRPEHRA